MIRRALIVCAAAAALSSSGCGATAGARLAERLAPCRTGQGPSDAYCGTLAVYEHREARSGRRIDLAIVVLPANGTDTDPDPLFFLAGGPGQGAAKMAGDIAPLFRTLQRRRDIVFVDQRGTGRSHPLDCRNESDSLATLNEPDEASLARLRTCLDGYDADVRFYTTSIAMDDLDDVRAHLGYERINLFGVSYGTRAALEYVRRHGGRVRAIVLDGVAPSHMRLPVFTARDATRALLKVLADCERDEVCRRGFPGLTGRTRALLRRLEADPPRVTLTHPRTGVAEEVRMEARVVASILFGALYAPVTASMIPALIERAERNDFQSLLALAVAGEGSGENMSVGMQLSVLCSEDAARVTKEDVAREAEGTLFGTHLLQGQLDACAIWPRGSVEPTYYEPVRSDVPALVLSGDRDPVTPPAWGDAVTQSLSRARHVIVPASGHGVFSTACGLKLIQSFVEAGTADGLDTSCAAKGRRPPFFVSPAGPDPSAPAVVPAP